MLALYAYAGDDNLLVVGTGNKVEDFGVGFFTKYGDGGVDISPIADLLKSEVYEIGKFLDIHEDIINAKPTDGLWEDGRTDEDQIGATYEELEWAMRFIENNRYYSHEDIKNFTDRRIKVLHIFNTLHQKNKHKIISIPIIKISKKLKGYDEKILR
jgi:NAD+ synthase